MPEWLLQKDIYVPKEDNKKFISKSIEAILKVLARLRSQGGYRQNKFGINPALKVLTAFMLVLLISSGRSIAFEIIVGVYLLIILSLLKVEDIKHVLKLGIITAGFTFVIMLPSILMGNENNGIMVVFKVFLCVSAVNILSSTTPWNDITGALKLFWIPDIIILVLDITIKYIILLGEFALELAYSLKLRSIGASKDKSDSLSGIMGTMFLKSKEMAEEMYSAMECRGFTGEYSTYTKFRLHFIDILYIIINIIIVLTYFYIGRL